MSGEYAALLRRLPPARLRQIDAPLLRFARGDVLEVGCGDGRLLVQAARLPGVGAAAGVDVAPSMARRAAARRLEAAIAPAERLPLPDQSFDSVLSGYYALRYADLELALAEAARVLRPEGRLGFTLLGRRATALRGRIAGIGLLGRDATCWDGARALLGRVEVTMTNDLVDAASLEAQLDRHGLRLEALLGTPYVPGVTEALLRIGAVLPYIRGDAAARWGYDVVVLASLI